MAYSCFLASVPWGLLSDVRVPADLQRLASEITMVSHYIAPACPLITQAMDGGGHLETDTWHPLRGFKFHSPAEVCVIAQELAALDREYASTGHEFHGDDFLRDGLAKVLLLFQHASNAGECVVTCLDLNRLKRSRA